MPKPYNHRFITGEKSVKTNHGKPKTRFLTGAYVRAWRTERDISRRDLGETLGYRGGDYVKRIEIGVNVITQKFAGRFTRYKNNMQAKEKRAIKSRYPLPPRLKILARPRKCKICNEWFIFPNDTDRVCTDRACRKKNQEKKK